MAISQTPILDPYSAGRALLVALEECLRVLDPGFDVPERKGMAPGGQLVQDGEQLTVLLTGITRGLPGQPTGEAFSHPSRLTQYYTFEINLLRRVRIEDSFGNPPTAKVQDDDAAVLARDNAMLYAAVVSIWAEELIVRTTESFYFGPVVSIGPEGDLAGNRCAVGWVALK